MTTMILENVCFEKLQFIRESMQKKTLTDDLMKILDDQEMSRYLLKSETRALEELERMMRMLLDKDVLTVAEQKFLTEVLPLALTEDASLFEWLEANIAAVLKEKSEQCWDAVKAFYTPPTNGGLG